MSQYERLKTSERNRIIQAYHDGKPDPNFDVIPSKSQSGKFTIRKKLHENANEKQATGEPNPEDKEQPQKNVSITEAQEANTNINPEDLADEVPNYDDEYFIPKTSMSKASMFREMQLQLNKMMLEQLKILRRDQKATERKRKKYAGKSKKIHHILSNIAFNEDQIPPEPEPLDKEERKAEFEIEEPKQEEENVNIEVEDYNPDEQPYDNQLQQMMAGPAVYSRRDRLKAFI